MRIKTVMKMIIVMLLCLNIQAYASSKGERITFIQHNASLETVFREIQKQTTYHVICQAEVLHASHPVTIEASEVELETFLAMVFKSNNLTYTLKDQNIVVTRVKSTTSKSAPAFEQTVQQQFVAGQVRTQNGIGISEVSIRVSGQQTSTSSDADGKFIIQAKAGDVLVFNHISYQSLQMTVGENQPLDIVLQEKDTQLDEIVVVGYGVQKKINLTGAVAQVGQEVLENRPAPSLSRMLQGTLPNLNLTMVDGSPTRGASFNVRGTTSIGAGGSALVLIDGVEGDPNLVNPGDIESVTVLKDAASSAVYGSRAAFGVVLITTKKPVGGVIRTQYNSNFSLNSRTSKPNTITNGYQWAKNFNEAFSANYDYTQFPTVVNNIFPFSQDYLERLRIHDQDNSLPKVEYNPSLGRYEYFGNTDWFDVLHRDAIPATEQAVSISGGSEKIDFYLSARYYFQDGIFEHNPDKFNRYNVRGKGTLRVLPWLTVHNNMELSNQQYHYPMLADRDNQTIWRMMDLLSYPMATVYNPDGSLTHTAVYGGIGSFIDGNNYSNSEKLTVRNTAGFDTRFFDKSLSFKGDFTYSRTMDSEERVNNYVSYSNGPDSYSRLGRSLLQKFTANQQYVGANITMDYAKTFNDLHDFKVLVGYNVEQSSTTNFNGSRDGLLLPNKPDFNLMDGLNYILAGGMSDWAYLGAFYRANYIYNQKYLLEVNGRYDGSSKFPTHQRFGFFPSVSAGWIISRENFFQSVKPVINELKFRTSYGTLGNGNVAPYRYLEQMGVFRSGSIQNGTIPNFTQMPTVIPEGLTWEKSTSFNLGLDFGLFQNRLTGTFDWYHRNTQDMFTTSEPLPGVFGATVPFGNYSDLSTKGWEFSINYKDQFDLNGSPFTYGFTGSLWDSQSKITRYNNSTGSLAGNYYVGHTIGEIWGYTTLGLFQSEEEIRMHADQSFLKNSAGNKYLPGDIKFADLNGDGKINQGDNTLDNPGDRSIIGNSSARYQFGFTLNGRYKNFGLQAFFQGVGKRDWYFAPEAGAFWGIYNRPYGFQPQAMMDNIWSEENPDAYFPRLRGYIANSANSTMGAAQTRYLQDASYLRLKNLTLDYSLPKSKIQKWGLGQATLFVTGQNLFTLSGLSKYSEGIDPEVIESSQGDLMNNSGQAYAYPMLKSITFGANISF